MRFLALILCVFSVNAIACPNLSGFYPTCRSNSGNTEVDYDVQVTQQNNNGVTVYSVSSTDSETNDRSSYQTIADGIERVDRVEIPEFGVVVDLKTIASCQGDTLIVETSTMLDGNSIGSTHSQIQKVGNQLHQATTGEMLGQEINDTVICE